MDWDSLYRKYGKATVDHKVIEWDMLMLMDDDVTNKKGIAPYVLTSEGRQDRAGELPDDLSSLQFHQGR